MENIVTVGVALSVVKLSNGGDMAKKKKRVVCEVCRKYEAVTKNFRKDGVKSRECTWCSDLSDSSVENIIKDNLDPLDYHELDYDEMSAEYLEKFKDDLFEIILKDHKDRNDLNRMLECERALTLKETG